MLERSQRGIAFAPETVMALKDRLQALDKKAASTLCLSCFPSCTICPLPGI